MGKCPWAAYCKTRNLECLAPLKVDKDKCRRLCLYWQDEKCSYKEIVAEEEKKSMRGYPALVKRTVMTKPREVRKQWEQASLKYSNFNVREQAEYWSISQQYDAWWEDKPEHHQEIIDCIEEWRRFMEEGLSPIDANEKVKEWLNAQSQTP